MTTKARTVEETAEEIIVEAHKQIGSRSLDVVKTVKLHDAIVELLTADREAIRRECAEVADSWKPVADHTLDAIEISRHMVACAIREEILDFNRLCPSIGEGG